MEKISNQIYMNYQAMCQKADRLEELAGKLSSIAEDELGYYSSNRNAWQGDSGDACREKVSRLEKKVAGRAKELENLASVLRKTAQRQYKVEQALISLVSR